MEWHSDRIPDLTRDSLHLGYLLGKVNQFYDLKLTHSLPKSYPCLMREDLCTSNLDEERTIGETSDWRHDEAEVAHSIDSNRREIGGC